MVILAAAGIQSPDYAPTRSWQQIFGGWTASSHPALSLPHNLHYTQQGLWIPVATRMTAWGSRIPTAARITADNEKALELDRQLFRVEGKWVLRQVGNGLATKKPNGPCQSVARGIRNPLLTFPSSLLRLLPSTIVKQGCARERGANPWKPICGATFSSWACRCYGPEVFVPYSFPRVNE